MRTKRGLLRDRPDTDGNMDRHDDFDYRAYVVKINSRIGPIVMSIDDIADHAPYQSDQAAELLGVCSHTFMRACRTLGIARWPYRRSSSKRARLEFIQAAAVNLKYRIVSGAIDIKRIGHAGTSHCSATRLLWRKSILSPTMSRTKFIRELSALREMNNAQARTIRLEDILNPVQ